MSALLSRRSASLAVAAILVTAGCGLKPSAVDSLQQPGAPGSATVGGAAAGGAVPGGAGGTAPGGGTVAGGTVGGATGTGTGGSGGSAGSTTGSTGPGGSASGGDGGSGTSATTGSTRIGIDDKNKTINILLHAPVTGAAPIPADAFEKGANLFWKQPGHDVFGYKVVAHVKDDQYRPDVARNVCEAGSADNFLVIGAAGTDQIQACASDQILARSHTPYLSAGVTTNGLTGLANYFAISLTYKDQVNAVVQNARDHGAKFDKCAIVTTNTPNFADVTSAAEAAFGKACSDTKTFRPDKSTDSGYARDTDSKVRQYGATTVFIDLAPTFWLGMLSDAGQNNFYPTWVGPGVTMGENEVVAIACQAQPLGLKAAFLSPYPGLDREPEGFKNSGPDSDTNKRDIEMSLYGLSEVLWKQMLAVGSLKNLTRENFNAAMPKFSVSGLSVYPNVAFNGGHFGGTAAWSLVPDCGNRVWKTGRSSPYAG